MSSELVLAEPPPQIQTRLTFPAADAPLGTVQVADELGLAYLDGDIDFGAVGRNEIFQNVKYIILTEYFSVPLDREFGMDYSMIDKPMRIAEAILAQEVAMKITMYEPRVQFREILYQEDMLNGKLSPSVKVALITSNELPSTIVDAGTPGAAPLVVIEDIDLPAFYQTMIEIARTPGPMGPMGPTGDAATIEVGSTTTGEPGTEAIVINVGDEYAAIFNFVIPQGEKGDQGTGVNIKGTVPNSGALPTTGNSPGDMWIASDTGHGWTWDGDSWTDVGPIQGPPGPQGPQGTTGAKGDTGAPGPVNVLEVASTETGEAGTDADVTIAGTSPNQSLSFVIPRGDVGAQGVQGTQGPVGATGSQGIQGVQGPLGPQGPTGATGPPGEMAGPASAVDGHIPQFNGTTGKLLKDGKAAPTGIIVGTTDTQELSNKTINVGGGIYRPSGVLIANSVNVITSNAVQEVNSFVYNLKAGMMSKDGDALRITWIGTQLDATALNRGFIIRVAGLNVWSHLSAVTTQVVRFYTLLLMRMGPAQWRFSMSVVNDSANCNTETQASTSVNFAIDQTVGLSAWQGGSGARAQITGSMLEYLPVP